MTASIAVLLDDNSRTRKSHRIVDVQSVAESAMDEKLACFFRFFIVARICCSISVKVFQAGPKINCEGSRF